MCEVRIKVRPFAEAQCTLVIQAFGADPWPCLLSCLLHTFLPYAAPGSHTVPKAADMQGGTKMLLKEKKEVPRGETSLGYRISWQLATEFRFHAGINKPPKQEKHLSLKARDFVRGILAHGAVVLDAPVYEEFLRWL